MSLRGHLSTLSVPEALQFFGNNRRTGVLTLEAGGQVKELVLHQGAIAFCTAGRAKERLGHHVLANTGVTESDLDTAFQRQARTGRKLGELLVEEGRIRPAELVRVLRSKLEDSVHDVFTWQAGTFEWKEHERVPEVPARLDLDWRDALLGGGERADETRRALNRLGDPSGLLRVESWKAVAEAELGPFEKELIRLAAQGLSVAEACAIRHETDFDVLTGLARLCAEGLLTTLELDGACSLEAPAAAGLQRVRNLLDRSRHLEAMELLRELATRNPADADVLATLRAATSFVRLRVEAELGGASAIPQLREEGAPTLTNRCAKERAVLERLNGRWPLASLVRISPLGELETLLVVDKLFHEGVVALRPAREQHAVPAVPAVPAASPRAEPAPRLASLEPGPGGRSSHRLGLPVAAAREPARD